MIKTALNDNYFGNLTRVQASIEPTRNNAPVDTSSDKKQFSLLLSDIEKSEKTRLENLRTHNETLTKQARNASQTHRNLNQLNSSASSSSSILNSANNSNNITKAEDFVKDVLTKEIENLRKEGLFSRGKGDTETTDKTSNNISESEKHVNNLTESTSIQSKKHYNDVAIKTQAEKIREYLSGLVKEEVSDTERIFDTLMTTKGDIGLDSIIKHSSFEGKSKEVKDIIRIAGQYHGVDPNLALAVAQTESSLRADVVSKDGHNTKGIFQLLDSTAHNMMQRFNMKDKYQPFDSKMNSHLGVGYLRYLHDIFSTETKINNRLSTYAANSQTDLEKIALSAYNAGEGKVIQAQTKAENAGLTPGKFEDIKQFLPRTTRDYVNKVDGYKLELAVNNLAY